MSIAAWCYEGRHVGTKPKYSQPCPSKECPCPCHGERKAPAKETESETEAVENTQDQTSDA